MPLVLLVLVAGGLAWLVLRPDRAAALDWGTDDTDASGGLDPMDVSDLQDSGDFDYEYQASPNRQVRGGAKVTSLIWHYTAGQTLAGAVSWLRNETAKASAHFVIGRDGKVVQLVPLAWAAWHAGDALVHNTGSIGVELVNPGWVEPDGDGGWTDSQGNQWVPDGVEPVQRTLRWPSGLSVSKWWVPYTSKQWFACSELLAKIAKTAYAPALRDQRGHEDIAQPEGRKTDPGPLFAWGTLVAHSDQAAKRTKVV